MCLATVGVMIWVIAYCRFRTVINYIFFGVFCILYTYPDMTGIRHNEVPVLDNIKAAWDSRTGYTKLVIVVCWWVWANLFYAVLKMSKSKGNYILSYQDKYMIYNFFLSDFHMFDFILWFQLSWLEIAACLECTSCKLYLYRVWSDWKLLCHWECRCTRQSVGCSRVCVCSNILQVRPC